MKIGIDAKWYYSGPPSGVNVVKNIVDNLIKFNTTDDIIFFLSATVSALFFSQLDIITSGETAKIIIRHKTKDFVWFFILISSQNNLLIFYSFFMINFNFDVNITYWRLK